MNNWIILALVVVIGISIVLHIQATAAPPPLCMSSEEREAIRTLVLEGIDKALQQHTIHIFDTWVKDPTDQPKRAARGMDNTIRAYVGARNAALKWGPPTC